MEMKKTRNEILAKKQAIKKEKKAEAKERELYHKMVLKNAKKTRFEEKIAPEGVFISLKNINKIYPNHVQAVYDFNLDIAQHEFIVFVGPSGCGKSTTLRMIAGLEEITSGDLFIDGVYCNELESKERDISMVFQSYALYPHMTVYQNLAFGMEIHHVPRPIIDEKVYAAADILQITPYLDRKPSALSGGQCQRVALGRAICKDAKVFLMDEPLSNLDAKLRVAMRAEIVKLHEKLNTTTIYVTHDQTEAMTMADRIVVMNKGYIQQIGKPADIYQKPANLFVATFIGSPAMNINTVELNNDKLMFDNQTGLKIKQEVIDAIDRFYEEEIALKKEEIMKAHLESESYGGAQDVLGKEVSLKEERLTETLNKLLIVQKMTVKPLIFGIRPEDIYSCDKKDADFTYVVTVSELLGSEYIAHFDFFGGDLVAKLKENKPIEAKQELSIKFDMDKMHLFDPITEKRIY